jgi:hypothetical protein
MNYTDKIGGLRYNLGFNAFTQKPIVEKVDEQAYRNDYQLTVGGPMDGIRGLKYLGRFTSDDEALIIPQFGETLHAGDLKYEDRNGDGVVDDNDVQLIGHSTPKLYYALNLNLQYKAFEFTIIGVGRAFYDIMLDNKYFTNGSGDNTYSKFVLNNVDAAGMGENIAAGQAYPKLTYYQISNNFKYSSFRLANGDFFKIQNVELAWKFPVEKFSATKGIRGMRLFVRGANLLTVSKIKDVEPENINAGVQVYPLNRTLSGGVKLTF